MAKPRSERFDEERPEVSEQEIVNAAKANRVVVSFGSFPVMTDPTHIGALAVKLSNFC